MADEAVNRLGAMLEELGARFELVVEAVSGFGGRLDALRQEMIEQFAEVGGQIRFLSEQIAENRRTIIVTREDLGAEIIRVGEALGKARVEFREQLSNSASLLREEMNVSAEQLRNEMNSSAKELREEMSKTARELRTELKQTNKSLAGLSSKFDRFDDRITVQTRDQDQRLKKLEKKRAS